ncbi:MULTISPECIES: hypothetical protein [Idiomarina]|uniref:hypothetical protein n=1 Tax=Idiomarina TaxID=135575 RepID=UPI00129CBFE5|nr:MULTISPECIES: hypothetical protein [Idiomarina]MRJ43130.1 hypothetical protein [Idiomarina sp. FeN1]NCU58662.1 hypothetical protein [Idiomarina sp. FenA--70]NCU61358.1 hypothetical protein [Idiomarina sp. FenBw--71]UUN13125.1 hypothetical protein KGF88_10865 [Idiomarina loihiensis]
MKLRKDLGFYVPAFFMIQVDVDKPIDEIIGTENERVLAHELIHFLQDVSTTYGLINISKCVDVIKSQNHALRQSSQPARLPLVSSELSDTVMANNDLFSLYVGDDAEKLKEFPESCTVVDVIEEEMDVELVPYPVKYIYIKYKSPAISTTEDFHFGAMAIYESMANLIESQIYGDEKRRRNFPYDAALMIAEYLCPSISHNKLAVSELCEASLMYYNPAEIFVSCLKKIHDLGLVFESPNEYYLYMVNNFTLEEEPVHLEHIKASELAESQLDDLFTVSPLKEEKWASGMVARAREIRNSNISISAKLWGSDKNKSRQSLMGFIKSIGMPIVFNRNFESWLRDSEESLYTPLMYAAIFSFQEIVQGKQQGCILSSHCANENSGCTPDHNCESAPWLRLAQGKSCYFSNIWKMWGLENVQIFRS